MATDELRPTAAYERYNIARNHVRFYNNIGITASYLVPRSLLRSIADTAFQPLVYAVLAKIVARHPALGICLVDEGSTEPKWWRLQQIDFSKIVKFIDADSDGVVTDRWIQAAHRVPLVQNEELPLWRVVVSRDWHAENSTKAGEAGDVSFGVGVFLHHAIGDGMSGGAFHLSFVEALNDLIGDKKLFLSATSVTTPPPLPLLPPIELATPLPVTLWYIMKQVFSTYVYSPPRPLHWSGPPVLDSSPRPPICNLRSFVIPVALATALVAVCRREKTTVTALVTVLVARRLAEMYPSHSRFTAGIPFSMRKFTAISNREIVVYVSNVTPEFSSEDPLPRGYIACKASSDLWNSARDCKAHLATNTESATNQAVGMTGYISDLPNFFKGKLGFSRTYAYEVSNIGVVDGNADVITKARFDRIQFSTALNTVGEPYAFCLATAKGGDMSFSLSWEEGVVGDDEAVALADGLEKSLRELISGA